MFRLFLILLLVGCTSTPQPPQPPIVKYVLTDSIETKYYYKDNILYTSINGVISTCNEMLPKEPCLMFIEQDIEDSLIYSTDPSTFSNIFPSIPYNYDTTCLNDSFVYVSYLLNNDWVIIENISTSSSIYLKLVNGRTNESMRIIMWNKKLKVYFKNLVK